jgi:hypothetical protein
VRSLDRGGYPTVDQLTGESGWSEDLRSGELADVLRSSLRAEYADASDEELRDALENIFDAMSPAEEFSFSAALNQAGKSIGRLAADPTFRQVVRTAAPIAGGALGTFIGGPLGAAVGTQLGNLAAGALAPPAPSPAPPAPPPAPPALPPALPAAALPAPAPPPVTAVTPAPTAPLPGAPVPGPGVSAPTAPGAAPAPSPDVPSAPGPASPVAGGSAAAAQGLVLCQHSDVLKALLAAALGQQGRQRINGIPVGQLLALLSQVVGQAAADADELMYLGQQADATEGVLEEVPAGSIRSLYADLIGADNLELAEAAEAGTFELAEAAEAGTFELAEADGWEGLDL